jgi:hypothetical protein
MDIQSGSLNKETTAGKKSAAIMLLGTAGAHSS